MNRTPQRGQRVKLTMEPTTWGQDTLTLYGTVRGIEDGLVRVRFHGALEDSFYASDDPGLEVVG